MAQTNAVVNITGQIVKKNGKGLMTFEQALNIKPIANSKDHFRGYMTLRVARNFANHDAQGKSEYRYDYIDVQLDFLAKEAGTRLRNVYDSNDIINVTIAGYLTTFKDAKTGYTRTVVAGNASDVSLISATKLQEPKAEVKAEVQAQPAQVALPF